MSDIFRKKIIPLLCFTILGSVLYGQTGDGLHNYRNKQHKNYYFGISFGLHKSSLKLLHSEDFQSQKNISLIESYSSPGYDIKVIGNLKIGDYWDFRLLPGFSFGQMQMMYQHSTIAEEQPMKLDYVYGELPFHVRYKSHPYKDMRVYVFGGFKYAFDISSKSRSVNADFNVSASDYSLEGGIGMQFFFPYFILSPEIKLTKGISNILINNEQKSDAGLLQKALSQMLTFSFHFEG